MKPIIALCVVLLWSAIGGVAHVVAEDDGLEQPGPILAAMFWPALLPAMLVMRFMKRQRLVKARVIE